VPLPPWIGKEVTSDPRYYNAYLARHPFTTWPAAQ
jgi:CYTH domain-containing protein